MEKSALILESSPWFIIICLLVGAVTAYLLYNPSGPWGKQVNYLFNRVALCFGGDTLLPISGAYHKTSQK